MRRIDNVYALDTIPDAFAKSKEGHVVGKLVVNVTAQSVRAPEKYDLVVYGSSPAGIAAAVAGGRLGLKVGLFEPLPMIGGMGAAGNLALNDGGNGAHTGIALEFAKSKAMVFQRDPSLLIPNPGPGNIPQNAGRCSCHGRLLGCRLTAATTTTTETELAIH